MNSRKVSGLVFAMLFTMGLVAPTVFSADRQRNDGQSVIGPIGLQIADGTPIPPLPPPTVVHLMADGGGPVPPLPPPIPNSVHGGFLAV